MGKKYYSSNQDFLDEDFEFLLSSNKKHSAAIVGWRAILQKIFAYNFHNKKSYNSTETALLVFFQAINDKMLCENIHLIYILTTQLEYSGVNNFSDNDIASLTSKIESTNNKLKKL
jgi:NADH/NAD ratio-sensing transcriptional regulator Rex